MAKNYESDIPATNTIKKGTQITGDVVCVGDIRIDGTLKGTLISEGKVVVGASGVIDGEITCKNADISGSINAKLTVKELLQLRATANIVGDINTNKLSIEPGANFTGTCNMGTVVNGIKNDKNQKNLQKQQTA